VPSLDLMREGLDSGPLLAKAFELQEVGQAHPKRDEWLSGLLAHFRLRRERSARGELRDQLRATGDDFQQSLEVLRRLQERTSQPAPATPAPDDAVGTGAVRTT